VVGEDETRIAQRADGGEERCEPRRVVEVGRHVADASVHLRDAGAADSVSPAAEVDEYEDRRSRIAGQRRRERTPHVGDRRKGRDHE